MEEWDWKTREQEVFRELYCAISKYALTYFSDIRDKNIDNKKSGTKFR